MSDASMLKRKRGAFLVCFLAGLLSVALALAASIVLSASNVRLFERGITENVDLIGLGISKTNAGEYAAMTIDYITGAASEWEPVIETSSGIMPISESFKAHMANVRSWFAPSKAALAAGFVLVLALLACSVVGLKRFSFSGWYAGAALPLLVLIGIGLWAAIDFGGMWYWLHVNFIPDGLFSASEPIMRLFPVELFAGYFMPAAGMFGAMLAVVAALPMVMRMVLKNGSNRQGK